MALKREYNISDDTFLQEMCNGMRILNRINEQDDNIIEYSVKKGGLITKLTVIVSD